MILSVVVPKLQRAQWDRLDEELKFVDWEIIPHKDPVKALELLSGRFVVFLEEDSAFEPGSIRRCLETFEDKPRYRKLAMISPAVDFDGIDGRVGLMYEDGVSLTNVSGSSHGATPVSVGWFYGSVFRTTAYRQVPFSHKKDALYKSLQAAEYFWSNGLRIEQHPLATYYAPVGYRPTAEDTYKIKSNSEALKVWSKEFIL